MRALAAAATAVAAPTPARLRLGLPLGPRAPRSGEPTSLPPPNPLLQTAAAVARPDFDAGKRGRGDFGAVARLWV